jgi:hypothetical protein
MAATFQKHFQLHFYISLHHAMCIIISTTLILKHLMHAFAIIIACTIILFYSFFYSFYSKSTLFFTRTLRKNTSMLMSSCSLF